MKGNRSIVLNGSMINRKYINGVKTSPTVLSIDEEDLERAIKWCMAYDGFGEYCFQRGVLDRSRYLLYLSDSRDATIFNLSFKFTKAVEGA